MRTFAIATSLVCMVLIVGCGGSTESRTSTPTGNAPLGSTVTLGQSAFLETTFSFSAGQALRLVDPVATGGVHQLCLGKDGQCDANAQVPDALHGPGMKIAPGNTSDILFPSPGQYQITCTIHPSMNLTSSLLGTGQVIGRPVAA
jgi:plastocyanin